MAFNGASIGRKDTGFGNSVSLTLSFDSADDFKLYSDKLGVDDYGQTEMHYMGNQIGVTFVRQKPGSKEPSTITFGRTELRADLRPNFNRAAQNFLLDRLEESGMDITEIARSVSEAVYNEQRGGNNRGGRV